ncbi:uncharacterized protein LOC119363728 [Triticum dicoccoides]|uniref:uncharacterized protein LOC119363728 n=1 Tax=Triticum dicoccoides TaxID=85692 RepID=UPI00188F40F4|nr:uncharacterized protein LOC119363728 [Triticum dicoccoides]
MISAAPKGVGSLHQPPGSTPHPAAMSRRRDFPAPGERPCSLMQHQVSVLSSFLKPMEEVQILADCSIDLHLLLLTLLPARWKNISVMCMVLMAWESANLHQSPKMIWEGRWRAGQKRRACSSLLSVL